MPALRSICVLSGLLFANLSGCASESNSDMPASSPSKLDLGQSTHYSDELISFDYPKHWKIIGNDVYNFGRLIRIEGLSDSNVSLTIFSDDLDMDFEEYCKSFTESMPASEGIATITKGTLIQVPTERENEQAADFHFMTDVSIEVASAKIPSTANYWKQVHGKIKVIGVTWVSDENRNDVNDGFQLIRDSLSLPNVNR